jgi:hypothetical protein
MWLACLILTQVALLVGVAIGRLSAQGTITNEPPEYLPSMWQLKQWRKARRR